MTTDLKILCRTQGKDLDMASLSYLPRTTLVFVACVLGIVFASSPSLSCSTFSYVDSGHAYVGKSYDWDKEQGLVHVNKRHVNKSALQVFPTDKPLSWTSKYGSVTLNQYGRELPNAGMNEAGVVVEVMVLGGSKFPAADEKPSVNESQWVQYMLDMAGSVDDVVKLTEQVRLAKILIPLHYMACDKSGACVAVEPIGGQLVVTDLAAKGNKVMTNDSYARAMEYLKNYDGFGGSKPIPTGRGSLDRFVIASDHIKKANNFAASDAVKFGFEGIEEVASGATKWRVVYDMDQQRVHFSTKTSTALKSTELGAFDFDCRQAVKVYDMASGESGNVSRNFKDYIKDTNSDLVRSSLGGSVPAALIQAAIDLPESTTCAD